MQLGNFDYIFPKNVESIDMENPEQKDYSEILAYAQKHREAQRMDLIRRLKARLSSMRGGEIRVEASADVATETCCELVVQRDAVSMDQVFATTVPNPDDSVLSVPEHNAKVQWAVHQDYHRWRQWLNSEPLCIVDRVWTEAEVTPRFLYYLQWLAKYRKQLVHEWLFHVTQFKVGDMYAFTMQLIDAASDAIADDTERLENRLEEVHVRMHANDDDPSTAGPGSGGHDEDGPFFNLTRRSPSAVAWDDLFLSCKDDATKRDEWLQAARGDMDSKEPQIVSRTRDNLTAMKAVRTMSLEQQKGLLQMSTLFYAKYVDEWVSQRRMLPISAEEYEEICTYMTNKAATLRDRADRVQTAEDVDTLMGEHAVAFALVDGLCEFKQDPRTKIPYMKLAYSG